MTYERTSYSRSVTESNKAQRFHFYVGNAFLFDTAQPCKLISIVVITESSINTTLTFNTEQRTK